MRQGKAAKARDPRPGMWASEGIDIPVHRPLVPGGLLLYHFPSAFWYRNAATIMDHVGAFERHSRFGIRKLNTDAPLPRRVAGLDFELIVIHYSVVGDGFYPLTEDHLRWLRSSRGHKVVVAQDENEYCGHRFWFCDEIGADTLYTLLEPAESARVYDGRARVRRIRSNLPGYVSERMVADGERFALPDSKRPIDIGYRGRPLPPRVGRGGREKYEVGWRFGELASDSNLVLDIGVEEQDRIYGKGWPRFLSRCKGALGVESGVSVFDLDDRATVQAEDLMTRGIEPTAENLTEAAALEDRIFYRTISPRHFEAAAMRTCQILFEGRYSGVMEPMVHYIPLRKDFSNLDEVLRLFRDPEVRRELTENAHRDLIASGRYSYERFIAGFDRDLCEVGLRADASPSDASLVEWAVTRGRYRRELKVQLRWIPRPGIGYVLGNLFKLTAFLRARLRIPRTLGGLSARADSPRRLPGREVIDRTAADQPVDPP